MLRIALVLLFGSLAYAQLDSNSVTVTTSRTVTVPPDQAIFSITVASDFKTTLSDVLTALQPGGITIANFSGVGTSTDYTGIQPRSTIQWTFSLVAPLTKTNDTVATLSALMNSVPMANPNLSVTFSIQGTQVSQQLQQSQTCPTAALISDATAQAQVLAMAGGRTLSGILAVAGSTPVAGSSNCSLTVKFALLGN